jgi:AcrR family transcriptional regulator
MPSNRDRALAAAIELLANEGIHSLTHLRVDERAGLPKGSTSNAFRTRGALLLGVCEHMAATELPSVAESFTAATPEELVESLVRLMAYMTGPNRSVTAARLALFVEAGHDLAVREALTRGRSLVEGPVREALTNLGAPDPALAVQILGTCFEGLFLHIIGRHAKVDVRAVIAAAVKASLSG